MGHGWRHALPWVTESMAHGPRSLWPPAAWGSLVRRIAATPARAPACAAETLGDPPLAAAILPHSLLSRSLLSGDSASRFRLGIPPYRLTLLYSAFRPWYQPVDSGAQQALVPLAAWHLVLPHA
jgi:hypothetical protein